MAQHLSTEEVLKSLNLQERLTSAMTKAGVTAEVKLEPRSLWVDCYDISGISVKTPDPVVRRRAAQWVQKALTLAGVKQWHTGAWQGPCPMGEPELLDWTTYGELVTMVCLNTHSIGD